MTLKDKLPDRLKCSPLLTMESDSDIETIAESIVNLSDSDGDFFKKTEKLLLMACLGYLRDWCEPSQRTIGNLISLLDAALPKDNETHTTLDNLFYEMKSGCKRVKSEDGITTLWEPSVLSRCDGLTPRDSNGIDVSEDFSLTCYEGFRHAATRETRTSIYLRTGILPRATIGGFAADRGRYTSPATACAVYPFVYLRKSNTLLRKLFIFHKFYIRYTGGDTHSHLPL